MRRPLSGRLEAQPLKDGETAWVARFRAYGQPRKLTIGHDPPWPETRAREELDNISYQVKRGVWVPPESGPTPPSPGVAAPKLSIAQLSHAYLEHRQTLGKGNKAGQQKELLEQHVIPDWGDRPPEHATPENVRRWVAAKVCHSQNLQELWNQGKRVDGRSARLPRPYGPRRLNRAINALYAVLDYGHVFPRRSEDDRQAAPVRTTAGGARPSQGALHDRSGGPDHRGRGGVGRSCLPRAQARRTQGARGHTALGTPDRRGVLAAGWRPAPGRPHPQHP